MGEFARNELVAHWTLSVWSVVPLHTNLRRKSERVPGRVPENPASTLETGLSYGDVDCDRGR